MMDTFGWIVLIFISGWGGSHATFFLALTTLKGGLKDIPAALTLAVIVGVGMAAAAFWLSPFSIIMET